MKHSAITKCWLYFGTIVEALQCLTDQTEWTVRTCEKETKHTLFWGIKMYPVLRYEKIFCFWVFRVCRRKNFFTLSPSYQQSPKNREKSLCPTVLQLGWVISTWWDENMTLFVFSACYEIKWNWFCGREQAKHAKIRRGECFSRGCLDRKEYTSNTANKRCSRQVLQLQCSSWYSIKFYT